VDRRKLYGAAQRVVAEDAPYICLWYKTNIAVSATNVEGVTLTPSAEFTFLRNVSKRIPPAAGAGG
jgi:ABC-type transport system substrate-binding protein